MDGMDGAVWSIFILLDGLCETDYFTPTRQNFGPDQIESRFADDKLKATKMIISVFKNIVRKGEIACILLFQKASFSDQSKGVFT